MARPSNQDPKLIHTIPLRLSDGLLEAVKTASEKLEEEQTVAMRLALKIGLECLRRCRYDVAGAMVDLDERGRRRK